MKPSSSLPRGALHLTMRKMRAAKTWPSFGRNDNDRISVLVPVGALPGMTMKGQTCHGRSFTVKIPEGAKAGMTLEVTRKKGEWDCWRIVSDAAEGERPTAGLLKVPTRHFF